MIVAVEPLPPVPRAVGKMGSVTCAVPPMVIAVVVPPEAAFSGKFAALKVPPVRLSVEDWTRLLALSPAGPPMVNVPTVAVPPVWEKRLVVLRIPVASERPTIRIALVVSSTPEPLRLNVAVELLLTPSMTPRVPATVGVVVVSEPPLRL